jgi:hypothetical protein
MDIKTWMEWYKEIIHTLGFKKDDDERSAKYLNDFLKCDFDNIHTVHKSISFNDLPFSENIIVFGAGPSLKQHIKMIKSSILSKKSPIFIIISADGATTALIEENIIPDIIVTDLDGKIDDLITANNYGAFMVIHAHGNNLNVLKSNLKNFKKILGTTQNIPLEYVHNFGGFTDGDRSVFLAVQLGAKKIIMGGMDFGEVVTQYSRPDMMDQTGPADDVKKAKLEYASKLVEWIKKNEDVMIYNLSEIKDPDFILNNLL